MNIAFKPVISLTGDKYTNYYLSCFEIFDVLLHIVFSGGCGDSKSKSVKKSEEFCKTKIGDSIMKPNVTIWLAAALAVSACGSSAQFASSGHQYQDGIYYKPTTENKEAYEAEDKDIQALIKKTKESEIYLFTDSGRDTIVVPKGNSVRLNFNNGNNTTVTFLNNDASLYPGYYPYTNWGLGFSYWNWDPWYYDSWSWNPWYYDSWSWSPWCYSRWYRPWSYSYWDYWHHYRWHDPWIYHSWNYWSYSPWSYYPGYYGYGYYPGYYGYSYYPGYYDYYVWDNSLVRGVPGERQSLSFGRSWGSREAISRGARGDIMGSYGSSIRRSSTGASRLSSVPNHRYGSQDGYRRSEGGSSTGSEGMAAYRRSNGSYEGNSRSSSGYTSSSSRSTGGGEAIRRSGSDNYRRPAGSNYGETGSSGSSYRRSSGSSSSYGGGSSSSGSYSRSSGSSSSYREGSSSGGSYSRSSGSSSSYGGGSSSGGSYSRSSGGSSSYGGGSSSGGSYSRSGGSSGGGSYRR